MCPSQPLNQSRLFHSAHCLSEVLDIEQYADIRASICDDLLTVNRLNNSLLEQFGKMEEGESIMVTVDRVERAMTNVKEVRFYISA